MDTPAFITRYSVANIKFLLTQMPEATDIRPASEWSAEGRKIRKGTKALKLWIPKQQGKAQDISTATSMEAAAVMIDSNSQSMSLRFRLGNVFDISQTETIAEWEAANPGKSWEPEKWKAERAAKKTSTPTKTRKPTKHDPEPEYTPIHWEAQTKQELAAERATEHRIERRAMIQSERLATIATPNGNVIAEQFRIEL